MKCFCTFCSIFIVLCSWAAIAGAQGDEPTVSITEVPEVAQNSAFSVKITFSEAVSGFEAADIDITDPATVTSLSSTDNIVYTAEITPNDGADGDVTFFVPANVAKPAGADPGTLDNNIASEVHTVPVDTILPTVEITDIPTLEKNEAFDITITFPEPVNGFLASDIDFSGPASISLSGGDGDSKYTATITPNAGEEGDVTIQVVANGVTDNAGNNNEASDSHTVYIDTIDPTVDSFAVAMPEQERNDDFTITLTFSEDVTGFGTSGIQVPTALATVSSVSGSGKAYTATITPNANKEGDVTFEVVANAVTDAAGNGNTDFTATDSVHIDTIDPTVDSFTVAMPEQERNDDFTITLTFSEDVTGFGTSGIQVPTALATVSSVSGSGKAYTATITPNANKEGDVTFEVVANAVTDAAGNGNTAFTATDSVHIDTIPPEVSISDIPDIEKNVPFDLTLTFTEAVNGFVVPADLTVTGSASASLKSGDAGDTVYVVTITPAATSEGDVTVQVDATTVKDAAQNDNTASNMVEVHIDTIVPTVDAITGIPDIEKNIAFDVTIRFSEAVNGFVVPADLTVTGPASASLASGSEGDSEYTVTITPDADSEGDVTVQVRAGAVKDFALNDNTVSEVTDSVHIDTIPPGVLISGIPDIEKNVPFDLTLTFTEAVNGFVVPADLTVTGSASASLKSGDAGDTVYTVTITPAATSEGDVTVQVDATTVKDAAQNDNTASNVAEVHIDTIPPEVLISGIPDIEKNVPFDLTLTFTEAVNGFQIPADLTVTGPASASLASGGDGDSEYTVTITPNANSEGDVVFQVPANVAKDFARNNNTQSAEYTVHVDTIAPTAEITEVPTIEKNEVFDITITFSEPVNGFLASDIDFSGPATVSLSGSDGDSEYTVTITPDANSEGDVVFHIPVGAAQDLALNNNTQSVEYTVRVDTIVPAVEITSVPDIEKNEVFDITITFSEPVNGFLASDIDFSGPATVSLSGSDGDSEYTVTITPDATSEGDVEFHIPAGAAQDSALNNNTQSAEYTVHVDTIPPTVEITEVPTEIQLEDFSVTIIFSEVVNVFEVEDIQITGDAVVDEVTLSGSGNVYVLDILPNENTDGDVIIKVPEDVAKDEATNLNTPSLLQTVFVAPKWIPDPNVRTVVREELGLEEGEDFRREQLENLTAFDGFYREINDLTGLEYATELTSVELIGNFISDLTPLANLTTLTTLILDSNIVSDISALEALTNLTILNLAGNLIDDITPLENLTALTTLNLNENLISDLNPLVGLAALTHLYLTSNNIRNVSPIVPLENLAVLEILENPIRNPDLLAGIAKTVKTGNTVPSVILDKVLAAAIRRTLKLEASTPITITQLKRITTLRAVPVASSTISSLAGLEHATALTTLVLSGNAIRDLSPLSGLTGLTILELNGNNISDVTAIAALTRLSTLKLRDNSLRYVDSLSDLTALTSLELSGNSISVLSALSDLADLEMLVLGDNAISDLRPLSELTALTSLELSGNNISDLTAIAALTNLSTLKLRDNSLRYVDSLSELTALTSLELSGNNISDLTPLSDLAVLETLVLGDNAISDLRPLRDLTGLRTLNLMGNTISNLSPLSGLTALTTLVLEGNVISDLTPLQALRQLRLLNLNGNSIVDIRSVTALTQSRRLEFIANSISDVQPLAGLLNLATLRLIGNPILDTTPLYPLTQRVLPVDIDIAVAQYPAWDVNEDGSVNAVDSALVTAALGQSNDDIVEPRTDVNNDDTVNNVDLLLVTENLENNDAGAPSVASLLAGLRALDKATLGAELKRLIAESDGSLKYLRAIAFLESLLAVLSPDETRLLANYPNPLNPETWIPYQLASSGDVQIVIYNARGAVVRNLELGHQRAGYYAEKTRAAYWDGRNTVGERVASGIYFYQLQTDNVSLLRKMVILK